jgi:hypothetical protein
MEDTSKIYKDGQQRRKTNNHTPTFLTKRRKLQSLIFERYPIMDTKLQNKNRVHHLKIRVYFKLYSILRPFLSCSRQLSGVQQAIAQWFSLQVSVCESRTDLKCLQT